MSSSNSIEPFATQPDFADMDAQEIAAIDEYNYEQAMFLCETRNQMRNTNIQDATEHYEQQLEEYNIRFAELLNRKKAANEEKYNEEVETATKRLQQRIEDLAATQNEDLQKLEARWREAREYQKSQIVKTVDTLLSSSQLLARSRRFVEAIGMRDKARAIQARKSQPKIEECDAEFRKQFENMLLRHEQAFNELIEQHKELLALLEEKREAADKTAEAECQIDGAYAAVEIMDVALCDDKNPDAAIPVVRHFSPRVMKNHGRSGMRSTAMLDENEEEEGAN